LEGIDPVVTSSNQCPRRVIPTPEKYEPLYAMLYYLYTDKVFFTTDTTISYFLDMPVCDAEEVFKIAHLYDLPKLWEKALHFLVETCHSGNIISRFFGEFALTYDEVGKAYEKVFSQYWNEFEEIKEFDEFFDTLEEKYWSKEKI
jgi:hypothetical protein